MDYSFVFFLHLYFFKICIFYHIFHTCCFICLHFVFVILFISPLPILKQIRSDKMRRLKEFWVHVKCVQFCKEAENDELATLNLKCGYNAHLGAPTPTFLSRSIWAAWSPLLPISSHLSQKNEEHKTHAQTYTNTNRHEIHKHIHLSSLIPDALHTQHKIKTLKSAACHCPACGAFDYWCCTRSV